MKMFVTGGTSSIGRVLLQTASEQGIWVRALVRTNSNRDRIELPGIEFIYGDVTDIDSIRTGMKGCQLVTHLAAIVGHNVPEEVWWKVNRDGSSNVQKVARQIGVESMVQVSSLSVLGYTQPGEIADEKRPIDIAKHRNLYQKTKYAADKLARENAEAGLPIKIVYPGFGFGCSQATSHPSLQEQTLLRMAAGKPTMIMGNGKNQLCLAYYKDTAAGILLAHQNGATGEGYILGNENLTFGEILATIANLLGKKPPGLRVPTSLLKTVAAASRIITGKSVFPPDFFDMIGFNWRFSNQKTKDELAWKPCSFEQAISETWDEYQARGWSVRST